MHTHTNTVLVALEIIDSTKTRMKTMLTSGSFKKFIVVKPVNSQQVLYIISIMFSEVLICSSGLAFPLKYCKFWPWQ